MSEYVDLKQSLERIERNQQEIYQKLFVGNGQPPLVTRIDRLEQTADRNRWNVRTVWAAVIGVGVTVIERMVNSR